MSLEEQQLHEIIELINKQFKNELSATEEKQLQAWLDSDLENKVLFDQLNDADYRRVQLQAMGSFTDEETALAGFLAKQKLTKQKLTKQKFEKKTYKLWPRIAAAAAILLIVGLSIFFYTSYFSAPRHSGAGQDLGLASNDIKPGSNKAYLVLSNGKRLSLTDAANGELAKEAGVEITKTADGQVVYKTASDISDRINGRHPELDSGSPHQYSNALNTIETPRGGQYQIRLPDGSKVWLNAASKLIYPVSFNGRGQREVSLDGEAYFEIYKNKLQPFVVKSKNQEVTVLGTHFNINSYTDEGSVKTTLLEGSVRVNEAVLKPGQQSILAGGKISVVLADLDETMAWQKGDFVFKNESLESIMKKISRWYDVEVVYAKGAPKNITLGGLISRNKNLSAVLKMMEMTKKVKFKVEGKKVTVLPVKK
ncbi:FecR family protein [Pedobacter nutrimenti]|uniref:FecR family protein n=1 Tax=Pedobacter nutrimenti TaxID=1241337 RepID=UPI00292FC787|nr:FecR domain-containing protein [Pedobacter nutrimenti]